MHAMIAMNNTREFLMRPSATHDKTSRSFARAISSWPAMLAAIPAGNMLPKPTRMDTRETRNSPESHRMTTSRGRAAGIAATLGLALLALGSVPHDLHAEEERGFHVRPFVGFTTPDKVTTEDAVGIITRDIPTDDARSFGIAVGTELFLPGLLWEIEYARRTANVDGRAIVDIPPDIPLFNNNALMLPSHIGGDVTMQSLFLNVAYHFNAEGRVSPFLHAGAGYANVDVKSLTFTSEFPPPALVPGADNHGIAYSYGAGLAFRLTDSVAMDLLYRRVEYGKVYTDPSMTDLGRDEFEVATGELSLGVRFSF